MNYGPPELNPPIVVEDEAQTTSGGFDVTTDDPDSGAGATNSPPDFADDASFGGSGDDFAVIGTDGTPLLADTQAGMDWLRDTINGQSSVGDGQEGGGYAPVSETLANLGDRVGQTVGQAGSNLGQTTTNPDLPATSSSLPTGWLLAGMLALVGLVAAAVGMES